MHKNILIVVGITILFLGTCINLSVAIDNVKDSYIPISNGNTLYVGGTGEGNYTKIQDAINDANDGDTVFVYNGTYYENIEVDKSINLIGENRDTTTIDGCDWGSVLIVTTNSVNISGFMIQNGFIGIEINSNNITIKDNNIKVDTFGIMLNDSSFNKIINNNISDNYMGVSSGIILQFSNSNLILDNNFIETFEGIELWSSSNNIIIRNTILKNKYSLRFIESSNNSIIDNTISKSHDGMLIYYSNNNSINCNNISSNSGDGILLYLTIKNNISENNIIKNDLGIIAINMGKYSLNNTITANNIRNNRFGGIGLTYMNNSIISNNKIISNNGSGIYLSSCFNNKIYQNNMIDNNENAIDKGINNWDDGKYGNYWDDYKERYPDAKKKPFKGIWDTSYEIDGGDNKDNCPLIKQWPDSRTRTAPRTQTTVFPILHWFLERFLMLEKLLSLVIEIR